MKKVLVTGLISLGLVLVGCGESEEEKQAREIEEGLEDLSQVSNEDENETEEATTTDPLEFVDKTTDDMIFIDGANEYIINSYYVSDKTDEKGFNIYEDEGFTLKYALVETKNLADADLEESKEVQIYGEVINDTKDEHYFTDRMKIKTDDKEVSDVEFGLNGAGAADQKNKFIDYFPLDYETPDSFTFQLVDPSFQGDFELEEDTEEHIVIEKEFTKE